MAGMVNDDAVSLSQKSYFSILPDEMLIKIFGPLEIYELLTIAQVCRRWNELAKTLPLWKTRKFHEIGNEKWLLNPIQELVMFTDILCEKEEEYHENDDGYAYEDGGIGPRSQISLLIRLNPSHKELTLDSAVCDDSDWTDVELEFRQALEQIWSTFGRHACVGARRFLEWGGYDSDEDSGSDKNCGCSIVSAEDALKKRKVFTRQEALQFILDALDPGPYWSNYLRKDKFILNEEGDIIEEQKPTSKRKRYKYKRISARLFSKVRQLFADNSSHFMLYNLSDACFSLAPFPYDCYATQLLVSETAAFFYNQFFSIV